MLLATAVLSYVLIFSLLALLAWSDHKTFLLPNIQNTALLLGFTGFHICTNWTFVSVENALAGAVAGGGIFYAIRLISNHFMQADTLGLGDVKFMAVAGFGLGIPAVFLMMSLGAFLGVLHGFILAQAEYKRTGRHPNLSTVQVPAGVGLTIATAIIMVWQFGFDWFFVLHKGGL